MPSSVSIGERLLFSIAALGLIASIIVAIILGSLLESTSDLLLRSKGSTRNEVFKFCNNAEEQIAFKSFMIPILLKELDAFKTGELENSSSTASLFQWTSPAHAFYKDSVSKFRLFLPSSPTLHIGDMWHIVPPTSSDSENHQLLSKTHYPPQVNDTQSFLHQLLSMFHPRPFLQTRSHPRGSVALLRAFNDEWLHIIFRVHSEFQLNEPPLLPFWFTPSHFLGELFISRNGCSVHSFHMHVPTTRKLNVDLEWFKENEELLTVEIGYVPKMELRMECLPFCNDLSLIKWESEISLEDGYNRIKKKMFPFQEVTYYPISDAFTRAKLEDKLIHSVILWGALDDQSC